MPDWRAFRCARDAMSHLRIHGDDGPAASARYDKPGERLSGWQNSDSRVSIGGERAPPALARIALGPGGALHLLTDDSNGKLLKVTPQE